MANHNVATDPAQAGDVSSTPIAPSPQAAGGGGGGAFLTYPVNMDPEQDRVAFNIWEIAKALGTSAGGGLQLGDVKYVRVAGKPTVFLPVQSPIKDSNSVQWEAKTLNELQRRVVNSSLDFMDNASFDKLGENLGGIAKDVLKDPKLGNLYLAEQAAGVGEGLLSRATAQIINPNLELLFQDPTLREFDFTFRMTARNENEGRVVKQIVRYFKENMAVRLEASRLFLKAPYVFEIRYLKGSSQKHPSINLIKKCCALLNCSVDYTPLGTYMTYDDSDATMAQYVVTLKFSEIEPIYDVDYQREASHPIGY